MEVMHYTNQAWDPLPPYTVVRVLLHNRPTQFLPCTTSYFWSSFLINIPHATGCTYRTNSFHTPNIGIFILLELYYILAMQSTAVLPQTFSLAELLRSLLHVIIFFLSRFAGTLLLLRVFLPQTYQQAFFPSLGIFFLKLSLISRGH